MNALTVLLRFMVACLGSVVLLSASVGAAPVKPVDAPRFSSLLCANLATEADRIANDSSDLAYYLSPFVAQELYARVVTQTAQALTAQGEVIPVTPEISALPCGDTVDRFMMAIKGRMELGMAINLLKELRPYLILFGLILILWFAFRLYRVRLNPDEDDDQFQDDAKEPSADQVLDQATDQATDQTPVKAPDRSGQTQ